MDTQRLYYLLRQYATRSASPAEEQELFACIEAAEEQEGGNIRSMLLTLQEEAEPMAGLNRSRWQPVLAGILQAARQAPLHVDSPAEADAPPAKVRRILRWTRVAAAAVIILIVGAGTWYWTHRHAVPIANANPPVAKDIAPGGNHAILTLSGGQTIKLDSAFNGLLASQGNAQIIKVDSGSLAYQVARSANTSDNDNTPLIYNTITTPRGGFYQLTLPDRTRVWLNAASSLRFPVAFSGKSRNVTVDGEAYFEVAPDKARPFIVSCHGTQITVLGTSFNINAYNEESSLQTTLVQGSVKYTASGKGQLLRPGQQAVFDPATGELTMRQADIDQVIAWKNGQFEFNNKDLATIMRQISRWYDIDIRYEKQPGLEQFGGGISRKLPLSAVLHLLENNGVHFKRDDRQLTVIP